MKTYRLNASATNWTDRLPPVGLRSLQVRISQVRYLVNSFVSFRSSHAKNPRKA